MFHSQIFQLRYTNGLSVIRLRELNGHDEISVMGTSTSSAVDLINRLIENNGKGQEAKHRAESIVTADRDHILAGIYISVFGKKINGKSKCRECGGSFELNFLLPDLQQHLMDASEVITDESGQYFLDGLGFRLPTGEDELAVSGMDNELAVNELLRLCVISGDRTKTGKIQEAMSRIAPVLQAEIKAVCPECGSPQESRFDIQTYLLNRLRGEQQLLFREVHRVASAYKWSHDEILNLPRRIRRIYAKMVEEDNWVD